MYCVASTYEWMSEDPIIQHTHKCTYCRKWINVKVRPDPMTLHFLLQPIDIPTGKTLCQLHQLARWKRRQAPLKYEFGLYVCMSALVALVVDVFWCDADLFPLFYFIVGSRSNYSFCFSSTDTAYAFIESKYLRYFGDILIGH